MYFCSTRRRITDPPKKRKKKVVGRFNRLLKSIEDNVAWVRRRREWGGVTALTLSRHPSHESCRRSVYVFLLQFFLLQYLRDRSTFLTSTYPWELPIFWECSIPSGSGCLQYRIFCFVNPRFLNYRGALTWRKRKEPANTSTHAHVVSLRRYRLFRPISRFVIPEQKLQLVFIFCLFFRITLVQVNRVILENM